MATIQLDVMMIPGPAMDTAAVLTEKDVARLLNLSRDTVRGLRLTGDGPAFSYSQGRTRYSLRAVRVFQAERVIAYRLLMASYRGAQ